MGTAPPKIGGPCAGSAGGVLPRSEEILVPPVHLRCRKGQERDQYRGVGWEDIDDRGVHGRGLSVLELLREGRGREEGCPWIAVYRINRKSSLSLTHLLT